MIKSSRKFEISVPAIHCECPECQTEFLVHPPKGTVIKGVERGDKYTLVWVEVKEEDADKQGRKVTMHEEAGDIVLWLMPLHLCDEVLLSND